jgi:uncharacterized protein YacL (UPF0231 family)
MSVLDDFEQDYVKTEMRTDLARIVEAEQADEAVNNGRTRNATVSKNTHFEYPLGADDEEVIVYFERLDADTGLEVMLWADQHRFEAEPDRFSDCDAELQELGERLGRLVADELDRDGGLHFEYYGAYPPSYVFSATFYI